VETRSQESIKAKEAFGAGPLPHYTSTADLNIAVALDRLAMAVGSLHEDLTALLSQYDVNAAAASVKVYAIKPQAGNSKACWGPDCCA
jgi:hypothetical protein